MPYIAQTWSIGIEEQFYLVWPWIVKYTKNYLKVLWAIVICLMVITGTLFFFADHSEDISKAPNSIKLVTFFYKFFHMLRIGCMAIGGIGAYYLYKLDMRVLRIVFSNYTQLVTYVIIIEMLLFGVEIPYINHEVYSILFLIIILNLAANPNTLVNLENKMMDYMGKISYSIYMWHNIAIIIGLKIAQVYNPKLDGFFSNALYYISTFIITFILTPIFYNPVIS